MGLFGSDKCDCCGQKVEAGVKSRYCGHWICSNCIIQRGAKKSHTFGKDTMLCPTCGKDTQLGFNEIIKRASGRG